MDRKYSVTEPHPTVPKSGAYLARGIGGAGNYTRFTATELTAGPNAAGPASRLPLKHYPRQVFAGRGGAGNITKAKSPATEEAMFMFDEEMISQRETHAPVYHIGRGGAANFINEGKPKTQRQSSNASVTSTSSAGSARRSIEGVVNKLQRKISRQ